MPPDLNGTSPVTERGGMCPVDPQELMALQPELDCCSPEPGGDAWRMLRELKSPKIEDVPHADVIGLVDVPWDPPRRNRREGSRSSAGIRLAERTGRFGKR